jgi:NTE family protein
VPIDLVGGVSMGAIIAGMFAMEPSGASLYAELGRRFLARNPANDWTIPMASLIRGRKTARLLRSVFGDIRIEELPIPFYCTSVDLINRQTVVHRSGSLAEAVLASVSIPGLFPPVPARDGRLLIDGGVVDNLPIAVMTADAGGPVIASDVSRVTGAEALAVSSSTLLARTLRRAVTGTPTPLPPLPDTIVRCMNFATADTTVAAREHASLVIIPDVADIDLLDWRRLPTMRAAGATAARLALRDRADLSAQG